MAHPRVLEWFRLLDRDLAADRYMEERDFEEYP
jgi:hypothetical protein